MKKLTLGLGVLLCMPLIIISPNVFAEEKKQEIELEEKSSEIYDITINNNWKLSSIATIYTNNSIEIEIKYLPKELISVLNEEVLIFKNNKKVLQITKDLVKELDEDNLILKIDLNERYFKSNNIKFDEVEKLQGKAINAFYMNYDLNLPWQDLGKFRGNKQKLKNLFIPINM